MYVGSLADSFQAGGLTMYVLGALSLVGLAVAIERLKSLRSERLILRDFMIGFKRLWHQGAWEELGRLVQRRRCVMSQVVAVILKRHCKPFDRVSMIASDSANAAIKKELQLVYPLNIIATISPLIGLFGTIIGMIASFRMIVLTGVSGDASIVADGISKALVTTAAGRIVGIPALTFYHYFKNRTARGSGAIEENINTILYDWLLEDWLTMQIDTGNDEERTIDLAAEAELFTESLRTRESFSVSSEQSQNRDHQMGGFDPLEEQTKALSEGLHLVETLSYDTSVPSRFIEKKAAAGTWSYIDS
ncbi:MotA/TolQ/ExbB proton channel family protein [Pelagicoccus sp. SDUM812002]|uniref:MotA/TolQ/ExbB proton channel family protein n=1 Tax=Pelagicoccus sp. SDUM812002 TaxID=3041266 RepID=UPI00280D690D|nr:MotA/TolQ/ExbB proton channel family protein [Pelagicoccus sp. SDUM812002]MDQ8188283.1 MotA/TolQ/ExbB proton channel family protein [Pelagicoccus sp. SDUM812002]